MNKFVIWVILSITLPVLGFSQDEVLVEYNFRVEGACGMCQDRIETTASKLEGVKVAQWDLASHIMRLVIDENKNSVSEVRLAIANAGHDNGDFKAPQEVYDNLHGCCKYRDEDLSVEHQEDDSEVGEANLSEYNFRVEGACGMCQDRIESTALQQDGVQFAAWNLANHNMKLLIDENKTSIEKVRQAIADIGHDNGRFIAPQEVYDNLHGCCKYRDMDIIEDHDVPAFPSVGDKDKQNITVPIMVRGVIYMLDDEGKKSPLIGATVKLGDSSAGTTTNFEGQFELDNKSVKASSIDVSYVGFGDKRIELSEDGIVEIILRQGEQLDVVEISYKKRTTEVSFIKPLNVETVTREELCKAACCNLSESFETNPSVDVAFSDAVTGTKQIQMLGLAGPYVQITRELIPDVRAMSSIYGLSMTPGPWIQSIQLIKGAGSVVNGYEAMIGQINVELKKPDEEELFHLNGYLNQGGRMEINSNLRYDVSPFVSTGLLIHGKRLQEAHDNNGDGFTDMPMEEDFVVANRWKFKQKGNVMGQVGIKISSLNHEAGSHEHFSGASDNHDEHWRMNNSTDRYEAWAKIVYVNPNKPKESLGLQLSAVRHDQESSFGNELYNVDQNYYYANLIYQYISDNGSTIRSGLSYQMDDISERIGRAGFFDRSESVPGAFLEYTHQRSNKFSVIPGIRIDHHSNYGWFVTPRMHAKYNFSDKSIVRLTAGRGLKTASIFAENIGLFSSSREVVIDASDNGNPYGLDAEVSWNYGINLTQGISIGSKELLVSADFYRTDFENQVVVDWETAGRVSFYNLEGVSYSNSFQIKFEYELLEDFNIRTAYRLFDVKTDYRDGLLERPMVARHRAFINMAYKTARDWHFDATLNWNGQKRLPDTSTNPVPYKRAAYSDNYLIMNAQVMKRWGKKWDVYLGVENLFDFKQENAIIASDDAFGPYFDASIVWAPLFGRNAYIGFRYNLVKE